jgi:hypothetical protein
MAKPTWTARPVCCWTWRRDRKSSKEATGAFLDRRPLAS